MMDRDAAKALIHGVLGAPDAPMQRLNRAVWEYLVDAADEDGRIRVSARQIAEGLKQERRPPAVKAVHAATAWLRKKGLLATVQAAVSGDGAGNTYQLAPALADQPQRHPVVPAARPGQDPAAAAVQAWVEEDTADEQLAEDIALWVAGIWAVRDGGPGWVETARQIRPEVDGLPADDRRYYARELIRVLARREWLRYDTDEGSLSAGPRLKQRHPVAAPPRRVTGVADRGY